MSDREKAQKSIIEYALSQLKQAITDAHQGKTSNAYENVNKVISSVAQIEKQNKKLTEEELQQKILDIANKVSRQK